MILALLALLLSVDDSFAMTRARLLSYSTHWMHIESGVQERRFSVGWND
jgi:hypothetical protein